MIITYQNMIPGEEKEISEMISTVFHKYIAADYCNEGIQEFTKYIEPKLILKRFNEGNILITAKHEGKIVGAVAIQDKKHISLLFVSEQYHQKGIAKELVKKAIEKAEKEYGITDISVNSSPYAVEIYEKLGFIKTDNKQEQNGIRYIPMTKEL